VIIVATKNGVSTNGNLQTATASGLMEGAVLLLLMSEKSVMNEEMKTGV